MSRDSALCLCSRSEIRRGSERGALRWLERLIAERLPPITEVALAAAALAELRHGEYATGLASLEQLVHRGARGVTPSRFRLPSEGPLVADLFADIEEPDGADHWEPNGTAPDYAGWESEPDFDYYTEFQENENERLSYLADEKIAAIHGPLLPAAIRDAAAELVVESYAIEVDGCDEDGNPEGAIEFFRRDPRDAIAEARMIFAAARSAPSRPLAMVPRGPSRVPRRSFRRRVRASARSPGRLAGDSEPEPPRPRAPAPSEVGA